MDYGTGAIFGCPAHDQRDLDFANKYGLPHPDVFVGLEDDTPVEATAFVPPKTEKVRYIRGFAGEEVQTGADAVEAAIAFLRIAWRGPWRDAIPPARLGAEPPALLGLPDSRGALRCVRRGARAQGKPAGSSAR